MRCKCVICYCLTLLIIVIVSALAFKCLAFGCKYIHVTKVLQSVKESGGQALGQNDSLFLESQYERNAKNPQEWGGQTGFIASTCTR